MDLNRSTLLGRLTRDPEVRTTPNGNNVANFSIATGRVWTDKAGNKQEKSEFHNCVVWGKLADIAGQYLKKATRIYAEGRLETRSWDGQDGVKRYRTEIIVDNFIMLDGPRNNQSSQSNTGNDAPPPADDEEIKVEDIPF